ncbi:MAG: hypothetical protein WCA63_08015, partial [Gallionella sp.]
MPVTVDFPLAAKRHWQDAGLLETNGRTRNAGQLYGFSAECGIKALLIALGYPTDVEGSPVSNPPSGTPKVRKHIHELVGMIGGIQNYANGRSGAKYTALFPNVTNFSDWSVDHRYWADIAIPNS